ncbi:hypothetical protein [Crossiella sp. NPDC003009]
MTGTAQQPSRLRDHVGRGLMGFNAVITVAVFVNGFFLMAAADDDRFMVEGWRTFGYFVFSAMWAMLAFRPRLAPAIWELVIFHKVASTVVAISVIHTTEGFQSTIADAFVSLSTILAYVLCRGWESWRVVRADTTAPRAA